MVSASAPGKIILFGEHAVVYGRPAIAVPISDLQATVTVRAAADGRRRIRSATTGLDISLEDSLPGFWGAEITLGLRRLFELEALPPFELDIESTIPVAAGMGSGAAVAVAAIRALAAFVDRPITDEQVNVIAYEIEKLHHGTPSGIDNTVITFARPVYFVRGAPIETFRPAVPFTMIIADTGVPSPTALSVGDVRRAWTHSPERFNAIFDKIGAVAVQARAAIESGAVGALGPLMNTNHQWLYEIGVSSPELENLVNAARSAGALGAKLSGGGRGGNMLALVDDAHAETVTEALKAAGAVRTIKTTIGA